MSERKVILRVRGGSHLYGLNRPESDEDFITVFIPTAQDLLSLTPTEIIDHSTKDSSVRRRNTADDVDDVHYSLSKYLFLALQNNPNILSVLFATPDNILSIDPIFEDLRSKYDRIVTKEVIPRFKGYAMAQKDKLTVKASRYFGLQRGIEFLEKNYPDLVDTEASITDDVSEKLNEILNYYKNGRCMCNSFNKGNNFRRTMEMLKTELEEYGWRVETEDFKRLLYDTKYAYHLIRLLGEVQMLMTEGRIIYPISGKLKEDIVRIRSGEVSYEDLMKMYGEYQARCDELKATCRLPEEADWAYWNEWIADVLGRHIAKEYA